MKSFMDIERRSWKLARELEKSMRKHRPRWSIPVILLRAGARDPKLRAGLLQLVDVFPSLSTHDEIREHFLMYIWPFKDKLPLHMRFASYGMKAPLINRLGTMAIRWAVAKKLAPYFIVSDERRLSRLKESYSKDGTGIVLDFLGELVVSHAEADHFFGKYLEAMRQAPGVHIAVKFSSLFPYFSPENYEESMERVGERFEDILRVARKTDSFVTVDAEHYDFRNLIEDIFCQTLLKPEFRDFPGVGIALQAYLVESMSSASRFVEVGKTRGTPLSIRLVKGAYWDTEMALARQRSWPPAVFTCKHNTDYRFKQLVYFLFQNWKYVHVSPATHNPESIAFAYKMAEEAGVLHDPSFEFQVLYGLGEPIRKALRSKGLSVSAYVPFGDLDTGMSYFARRILENTANEGVLLRLIS